MQKKKKTLNQKIDKIKKKSSEKIDSAKSGIKRGLNINRYNKKLFILETILFIGVVDEFFEISILKLDFGIYLNVILLMLSIGILFSFALAFIEKITKGTIIWLVRLNSNKILRLIVHAIILSVLFYLYAKVFFGTEISLVFNLGLNAT